MMVHLRITECRLVIDANIDIPTMFRGVCSRNSVISKAIGRMNRIARSGASRFVRGCSKRVPRNSWIVTQATCTHDDRLGSRRRD